MLMSQKNKTKQKTTDMNERTLFPFPFSLLHQQPTQVK